MKHNKNTNFRITYTLCALEYVHLVVAEVPPTGNSLVPQRSCFHWYSLKVHHPQNVQKQQKSSLDLKWFFFCSKTTEMRSAGNTHTHSQQSPAVLPVRPSSLTRLSPVFYPSALLRLLSSVYSVTVTTSCPTSGTGRVGAPVLLQDIQLPREFRGRAALRTVCYESVQNKYTHKTAIYTFTPTNMK